MRGRARVRRSAPRWPRRRVGGGVGRGRGGLGRGRIIGRGATSAGFGWATGFGLRASRSWRPVRRPSGRARGAMPPTFQWSSARGRNGTVTRPPAGRSSLSLACAWASSQWMLVRRPGAASATGAVSAGAPWSAASAWDGRGRGGRDGSRRGDHGRRQQEDGEHGRNGAATGEPQDILTSDGSVTLCLAVQSGQPNEGPGNDWYGVVRCGPVWFAAGFGGPRKSARGQSGLNARSRKAAICSRVTAVFGQYLPSPQPPVTPASARALIAPSSELLLSSV